MRISLKTKLVAGFVAVITLTGAIATAVGVRLVSGGIVREVENRMELDLNSAGSIFVSRLARIRCALEVTALREFTMRQGLRTGERPLLLRALRDAARVGELDFAGVVDAAGRVVARAGAPGASGDEATDDPIVRRVLETKDSVMSSAVLGASRLAAESPELAERARMSVVPTPEAAASDLAEVVDGLVLEAAAPILDDDGSLLGAIYGGVLLNRDHEIVDAVKDTIYRGARYGERDIGVATIFLGDVRISTNVVAGGGMRALGTRLSREVRTRVIESGQRWSARASVVGEWYFTAYEPLLDIEGAIIGSLAVGLIEQKYADLQRAAFWSFVAVAVGGMLLATAVGYALALAVVRPLRRLRHGATSFARGDLDHRVDVASGDELETLAEAFNTLAAELKTSYGKLHGKIEAADVELKQAYADLSERQSQLVHAEKLASVGALAAGVAHEINNPLGTINLYAQMTLDELPPNSSSCRGNLDVIIKHATRAAEIVKNLLAFARRSDLNKETVSVNALAQEVLSVTAHQAKLQNVRVETEFTHTIPTIEGDGDKLRQVLLNIIVNALQAMPSGGTLRVASSADEQSAHVILRITDSGHGMDAQTLKRIFDPFFTTKETGKGTGLGLSVSQGIVEQHRGSIEVESAPGCGTSFTITLPAPTTGEPT